MIRYRLGLGLKDFNTRNRFTLTDSMEVRRATGRSVSRAVVAGCWLL